MASLPIRSSLRVVLVLLACIVIVFLDGCSTAGGGGGGGGDGTIPPFSFYASVAVTDLNGDGLPDIATCYSFIASAASHSGSVAVYLQDPARPGAFFAATTYSVGNDPSSIAIGDLDGDGRIDIVIANTILSNKSTGPSNVSVLLQDPAHAGQFLTAITYATGLAPVSVTIGDLNGDGKPDLAVADNSGVSLLLQDPNIPGRFLSRTTPPSETRPPPQSPT